MFRLTATIALMIAAGAASAETFGDVATVERVEPLVAVYQVPQTVCDGPMERTEQGHGGAVLGTVIGGLVGSRIGEGNGKVAAAVAGAGLGAVIGNERDEANAQERPSCRRTMVEQTRDEGYRVHYRYNGHEYVTRMARDPGNTVPVNVTVVPLGN